MEVFVGAGSLDGDLSEAARPHSLDTDLAGPHLSGHTSEALQATLE
jgi:hypothetical protein